MPRGGIVLPRLQSAGACVYAYVVSTSQTLAKVVIAIFPPRSTVIFQVKCESE